MADNNSFVGDFLDYNRWANLRLLDACLSLTPSQLASDSPGTYGTIYDTLVHLIKAEASYYRRLSGIQLNPSFSWEDLPSVAEIKTFAEQVDSAWVEIAEQMRLTDVIKRDWQDPDWEGQPHLYKAISLLIQVINHGVEHRTNITTIMAQQAIQHPDLDGWEYMRLNPARMAAEKK
jgi:uncharacterized damage-inducible protein DinB